MSTTSKPYTSNTPTSSYNMNCFQNQWKNKPQTNSVGAAALIFIAGGMNVAWSIGFTKYTAFVITKHVAISWFIGALIGVIIGALLNNVVKSRKYLYLASALLVLIDGIICIAASRQQSSIIAAHYIDGIAVGLIFVPAMVLIGEESVPYMRGKIAASVELMCFFLGAFIEIIFAETWSYTSSLEFNIIQVQGVVNIMMAILAAFVTLLFYIESPVYHMMVGDEQQALENIQKLQNPPTITTETYEQLHSTKEYVAANDAISTCEGAKQGWPALAVMIFFRTLVSLSFSYGTTVALQLSSAMANGGFPWAEMGIVYGVALFAGAMIGMFMMDSVGRKTPTLVGALTCVALSIAMAVIFGQTINLLAYKKMRAAMSLVIIYQFFGGFYTVSSSAYLTEAFPMHIKPFYIGTSFGIQMLVQLIVICSAPIDLSIYFYILAAFNLIFAVIVALLLPETKQTTLLGAQNMFHQTFWK